MSLTLCFLTIFWNGLVSVRLFNKGLDIVEVSDDGRGVPLDSRASLALPHATSKICSFDDIYDSQKTEHTLGFRGEALYSLANLSTKLVVATRCATDALAQKMEFARDGTLQIDQVMEIPRKVGTTVAVVGLLAAVPVRRRDLEQRIQQHRARLVQTVLAYAVFATGVRLHLMDIVVPQQNQQHAKEKTILATAANSQTLRETVSSVLGAKFLAGLVDVEIDLKGALLTERQKALPLCTLFNGRLPAYWPALAFLQEQVPLESRITNFSPSIAVL